MIVKILSSASNFEGIDYSERKNELGKSQLLKAENFGALGHSGDEPSKADYINYHFRPNIYKICHNIGLYD